MKKIYLSLLLLILFIIPLKSQAYVIKSSDFIYVAKDEIIEGNLYFQAKSVTIEGQVWGDIIGVSSNLQINGQVKGDVIAISQNINITGKVDGNLRAISNSAQISGIVNKNINFLGESLILSDKSIVGQDVLFKNINTEMNGKIEGNAHGYSNNVLIRGEIKKDTNITLDKTKKKKYFNAIKIEDSAVLSGSLNYKAGKDAIINTENIKGNVNKKNPNKSDKNALNLGRLFYSIFSLFLVSLLLNYLFKNKTTKLKNVILEQNYKTIGGGLALLFLVPIITLLLLISIVGIPIALILISLWAILLFLSKIIIALTLGDFIFKLIKKENIFWQIKSISGITILCLLFSLPYIGWFFSFISLVFGLGSFYYLLKQKKYDN